MKSVSVFNSRIYVTGLFICALFFNPHMARAGKKLFETYYLGDRGTMYFIKPLYFESVPGGKQLSLDLTIKYRDLAKDSATLNLSTFDKEVHKGMDSLRIDNGGTVVVLNRITPLFTEKKGKNFECRLSMQLPLAQLKALFEQKHWTITVFRAGTSVTYSDAGKTSVKIDQLRQNVFAIF